MRKSSHRRNKSGRHNRRGRNKSGNLFTRIAMISSIILMPTTALGVGGYFLNDYINTPRLDTAFCYESKQQYQTAFFADFSLTQQISGNQQRDFMNAMKKAYRNLPANGRISFFTTAQDADATIVEPVFTICRPPKNAREQKSIGAPEKTTTVLKRDFKEAQDTFSKYVDALIRDGKDTSKIAKNSPVLEMIQAISHFDFASPLRKLHIYSDGIQNTRNGRFCMAKGELPPFSKFKKRPSYSYIKPDDLKGINVEFLLVEFTPLPTKGLEHCTTLEVRRFWTDFLKGNGADHVRLIPLRLGAGT